MDDFVDPYVYPGTTVLRNLPGERTAEGLAAIEYELTFIRRDELEHDPITGPFDFARLRETHRRLFQDIYEWAGQPRTVEISKGSSQFHHSAYIHMAADQTFAWLADSGLLAPTIDEDGFVALSADLLEKVNYIHPFREGNGRTQRAFLDQIAALSGRTLAWRNVAREDYLRASVHAFADGHGKAFRTVLLWALRPPIDGLARLDPEVYVTTEPRVSPQIRSEDQGSLPRSTDYFGGSTSGYGIVPGDAPQS